MKCENSPGTRTDSAVILFDGVCNFCNAWVNFVIDRDQRGEFCFATQQSPGGQAFLHGREVPAPSLSSIILLADDHVYIESTAMLRVCARLQSPWRFLALLLIIPRPVRDAAYRWFAKHRYRWFGRSETCRVPTPDVRGRFILAVERFGRDDPARSCLRD
jgi:predicted DCC family thiol-disulfide oxidoreductase YuxK